MEKAYFVDGYHGGIKGHMPLGSWADVIRQMELNPAWKLCLDIEPISWEALRRTDPESYAAVQACLAEGARMEMLAGSYAQPFGWVIGGESNIRHLIRGRQIIEKHFPGLTVDTYATQEPCWTSSLPQILRSIGYKRAVLKNPGTAWGGYASGINEETVWWVGPDGTSIPCVPRYGCEDLVQCWETEAAHLQPEFVRKCLANGIVHPAGSFLQDLGWPSRPLLGMEGNRVQYVTWREYMEEIAAKPERKWLFTQEDILCTLPWGESTLQRMAREVRAAENAVIQTEKLAALASVSAAYPYPEEKLRCAWDQLLLAQHHDAWICATTREGREQWAWQAGAQTWMAEQLCEDIRGDALESLRVACSADEAAVAGRGAAAEIEVLVFNTSGRPRSELTAIELATPAGTRSVLVKDAAGREIPSQLVPTRLYAGDDSVNAGQLLFAAEVPATGCSRYTVEPSTGDGKWAFAVQAETSEDGRYTRIVTDRYDICIDAERGGVLTELFDKKLQRSFVDPAAERALNEYTGYAVKLGRFVSSAELPGAVTILESGPLRAKVEIKGKFADTEFVTVLTAAAGQARLDFRVRFHFAEETWIGDPWDIEPENRVTERRKSHHDSRCKLQAVFPVALRNRKLYKHSAFDVTKSRHADTYFQRWDEIKHNNILDWIDVYDEEQNCGFALFSDHTTGYGHSEDEGLALTLGWGGEGGFWWGKCPLKGVQELQYSILPHGGRWDEAGIPQACAHWQEPLLPLIAARAVERAGAGAASEAASGASVAAGSTSLLQVDDDAILVTSIQRDGADLLVRLFNASETSRDFALTIDVPSARVSQTELDGRHKAELTPVALPDRGCKARLSLQKFGIATVRIGGLPRSNDSQKTGAGI